MLSFRTECTIYLKVPIEQLQNQFQFKVEPTDSQDSAKESEQLKMLGEPLDDGGWEPVANVRFQSDSNGLLLEPDEPPSLEEQLPPPPQFSTETEIQLSQPDEMPTARHIESPKPQKQYVYGTDEEAQMSVRPARPISPLVKPSKSRENIIEAEIREAQLREEALREEAALRNREKVGGASSPSSHTSDEGFVDRPPEDTASNGCSADGIFTHTLPGKDGEPVIYDAISPVTDYFPEKMRTEPPTATSETKIALEIRELREREAELRAMRELRQKELQAMAIERPCSEMEAEMEDIEELESSTSKELTEDHLTSFTTTTDEGNYSECGDPTSSEDKSSDGSNSRIMSPDLHSYGSSHADTRQRRVTVKPFEDIDNEDNVVPIYTRMKKESVIEREIRLANEREEAFRKEKGLPLQPSSLTTRIPPTNLQKTLKKSATTTTILDTTKSKSVKSTEEERRKDGVQKLVSNFIQLEIEEASQRERELKHSGHIRTLSQDTVDSKIARIPDGPPPSQIQRPRVSQTLSTPIKSSAVTAPKGVSPLTPHTPLARQVSPLSPTAGSPYVVPPFTPSPLQRPPAPTRLTRSLSTNNLSIGPFGGSAPAGASNFRPKGLMQKFIASRGKLTAPTFNSSVSSSLTPPAKHQNPVAVSSPPVCANGIPTRVMKVQPKTFVLRKENNSNSNDETPTNRIYKRTHTTAEEKIQEELREMKNREEELRRLRARNLARSQPNLAGLNDEDEEELETVSDGVDTSSLHQELNGIRSALSNPNLLDVENEQAQPLSTTDKGTRRKSALIAHWEGKIQQTSET